MPQMIATISLFFAVQGCKQATVVNGCDYGQEACLECAADSECRYAGNPCTETVYCAHDDASIAVIEIGCDAAIEYAWPDAGTCQCVERRCEQFLGD